jgi:hypothetical protein
MAEERVTNLRYEAHRRLCGKELRDNGKCESHKSEQNESKAHDDNVTAVAAADSAVNNRGYY